MLEPATTNVAYCTAFGPLGMDKPVLTTVPLRYTFGTHSAVALSPGGPGHKAFSCHSMHSDEQLFNLHLKCIDLTAWQHGQKDPCWQGPILPPAAPRPSPLVLAGFYAQGEARPLGARPQTRALERAASNESTPLVPPMPSPCRRRLRRGPKS